MTSKYYMCCEKCFEKIARLHGNAARLLMDLCALRLSRGEYVKVRAVDMPELRLLEIEGYVCSIESPPTHLIINIRGHYINEDGLDSFCLERGSHE